MNEINLLDTGGLIAVLYRRDQSHKWAIEEISKLPAPLFTCEAVLSDACLVRMSEIYENSTVFTTDGDFRIYRKNTNQIIPTIMPE